MIDLPSTEIMSDRSGLIWIDEAVPYFRCPLLSACPQLSHAIFTRLGGRSHPPYDRLNTSYEVGDLPDRVAMNLALIQDTFCARELITMRQVHGTEILVIRTAGDLCETRARSADAIITNVPGLALLVKQADCQGIILFDPNRSVLAVAHCGWRGNVADILGAVVVRMKRDFASEPGDLLACIGPSLGPCCAEFVDYETLFPEHFQAFKVGQTHFDLKAISQCQLLNAGVRHENIHISNICTRCRTDLFYSYRGEGATGRFGTVAMLRQGGLHHEDIY